MKTLILKTTFLLLILVFFKIDSFGQSDAELKQKIEAINRQMAKDMIEGNYTSGLKNYVTDAISMPNNSRMVQGIDEIRKSTEVMMQSGAKFTSFESKTMQVISSGNLVTEIGTYKMSMNIPGMPNDFEDQGKYLTIWEKQSDGSLKIKVEMWNTDVNNMGGQMN
jgi:ketosteroid isomerase-like protein